MVVESGQLLINQLLSMAKTPTMKDLLEAGSHFGHQSRRWNPKMAPFIFGEKAGVHIIDLEKTEEALVKAAEFVKDAVSEGGEIIFLATKRQAQEIVKSEAERSGAMFLAERWLGGLLTNFDSVRRTLEKIPELEGQIGDNSKFTKKEQLLKKRELSKLLRFVGGVRKMEKLPQVLFVVDAKKEVNAIREAQKNGVTTVALVDTNGDPTSVDYPIPANDDAIKSITLIVKTIADAVFEGKAISEKKAAKEAAKAKKVSEKEED